MKGCLKTPSPLPSPGLQACNDCLHSRKCVAFEADGSEQVFVADEWDRTPTEPTRRLSYQDLMELREIQRSLPLANQPPDPITGRPGRHYLTTVPISLLPLLPQSESGANGNGHQAQAYDATHHRHHNGTNPQGHQAPRTTQAYRHIIAGNNSGNTDPNGLDKHSRPPNHMVLPSRIFPNFNYGNGNKPPISNPIARRPKTNFAFLPLLDSSSSSSSSTSSVSTTPLPSNPSSRSTSPDLTSASASDTDQTDPPTPSLTNASLDSPISCASSLGSVSPEPSFLQLPPKHLSAFHTSHSSHYPSYGHVHANSHGEEKNQLRLHFGPTDSYFPDNSGDDLITRRHFPHVQPNKEEAPERLETPVVSPKPARKRNVIVVNDMEIELDDEETLPPPQPVKKKNVIVVNDVEIELDDEEEKEEAPSIHNSAENRKPPENKVKDEAKVSVSPTSSRSATPPAPPSSASVTLLTSSALADHLNQCNFGQSASHAESTGSSQSSRPHLKHNSGLDSGSRPGAAPPKAGTVNSGSSPTSTGCAADFGSLHMPLRFKRNATGATAPVKAVFSTMTTEAPSNYLSCGGPSGGRLPYIGTS